MLNRSYFLILCSMGENNTKSRHLEFYGSLTLNNEKLIRYFGSSWYVISF